MKKTVLLSFMAAIMLPVCAMAQDTIHSRYLKAEYFYNKWIDSLEECEPIQHGGPLHGNLRAKRFYSKDSIRVKGLAAILGTEEYDTASGYDAEAHNHGIDVTVMNKTYENAYEYLSLYRPDSSGGLTRVSDSLYLHIKNTPPAYYLDLGLRLPYRSEMVEIMPVHELYFDTPVTVGGKFYIGVTQRSYEVNVTDDTGRVWLYSTFPVDLYGYEANDGIGDSVMDHSSWYGGWFPGRSSMILFLFPILDTIINDTTGIASPQLLGRYVSVVPNPAAERVQVVSSFGLREVEVYDAGGVCVLRRRLTGYTADLDVSALPAGVYLVRVATPSGTVTKKLIVQRR